MRDVITHVAQLAHETLLASGEMIVEDIAEGAHRLGDDPELILRIGARVLLAVDALLGVLRREEDGPIGTRRYVPRRHPFDVRIEHLRQGLQRGAHSVDIAGRHQSSLPKSKLP